MEIENGEEQRSQFSMSRRATTQLVLELLSALEKLPPEESDTLDEQPLFQGYPEFQTGTTESGAILFGLRLRPFPTMHFLFNDEHALQLAREITEIASTPKNMRYQRTKH
jgi:hypothetical protein